MFKQIIFSFVAILLIFGVADAQKKRRTKTAAPKPQPVKKITLIEDKDEYAVYEAVLRDKFQSRVNQTIVLNKEVTGCSTVIDRETEAQFPRSALDELFSDCYGKKWGNYELVGNYFQTEEKIVLVTEDELGKLFIPTCDSGWRKFYRKYPNSVGNTSFSRVGFDTSRNFAVVNFGNQSGCLAGGGQIVFLQKENEIWQVKKTKSTWVS